MLLWDEDRHAQGMAAMDATHRDFVAYLNRCLAADDAAFPVLFAALGEHCRCHFERESELMRASRFPAIAEHESEHRRVLAELDYFRRAIVRGRLPLARHYANGVADWFVAHLATMDAALAASCRRVVGMAETVL